MAPFRNIYQASQKQSGLGMLPLLVLLHHQLEPWMHLVSVYGGLATEMKLSGNNSFISVMRADIGTSTADLGLSGLRLRRCNSQE